MKICLLVVALAICWTSCVSAFAVVVSNHHRRRISRSSLKQQQPLRHPNERCCSVPAATSVSRALSVVAVKQQEQETANAAKPGSEYSFAQPEAVPAVSIYEKIGIEEDKFALGVKPEDFYKFIGTREDVIDRTMNDLSMDRSKAEQAVDKFLLDAEMINLMIEFQKRKADDPNFFVPKPPEESPFSFQNIVTGYILLVLADITVFPKIKAFLLERDIHTNIALIDKWIESTPRGAAGPGEAAIDATMQTVSDTALPGVSDAAAQAVSDVAQTVADVATP